MKRYNSILILMAFFATVTGCKKYETYPVDQVNIDRIFDKQDSLGTNAYKFLNGTYAILRTGHNRIGGDNTAGYLDAASDDAVPSANNGANELTQLANGQYNSGTFGNAIGGSSQNLWAHYYAGIRKANIFITNIDVVPVYETLPHFLPKKVSAKYAWKAEARFLRAFYYFELVKRYGGVPLIGDKVFTVNDNLKIPRNSFSACIDYMVKECDAIKDTLYRAPLVNSGLYGRVTQGAAMMLKAKILLYAASELYNEKNIAAGNELTGNVPVLNYSERWQAAAKASKDVIDLNTYALFTDTTSTDFRNLFLTQHVGTTVLQDAREVIFERQGDLSSTSIESSHAPIGFPAARSTGNTSPTQELVNSFPMKNGIAINTPGSGYVPTDPYFGRDPRLEATVFHHGSVWLGTNLKVNENGQSKPNNGQQQTLSGYYLRKFMGKSEATPNFVNHLTDWIIFRYAETLLTYCEAQNEVSGPNTDIYNYLIEIRKRAGIDAGSGRYGLPITGDKNVMREIIRNERRIELAFEENRFYDIRRWKICDEGAAVLANGRGGVRIITSPGGAATYSYEKIAPALFPAGFDKKRYFMPIPYDEVNKNPQMKQNPGW
ncbi:MAG: RagB/SusD family nutrient uptake outer membrane protein [Sphingobacteriaceae bacterium]|nr:MAG: RagB/SusD family nutrient uptake outer membrane protein [Sphingobacteriaceae bacterium]